MLLFCVCLKWLNFIVELVNNVLIYWELNYLQTYETIKNKTSNVTNQKQIIREMLDTFLLLTLIFLLIFIFDKYSWTVVFLYEANNTGTNHKYCALLNMETLG